MFSKPLFDPAGRRRRAANLKRLINAWPHELIDVSIAGRQRIIVLLEEAIRRQRTIRDETPEFYDPVRHVDLRLALDREREALAASMRGLPADPPMLKVR